MQVQVVTQKHIQKPVVRKKQIVVKKRMIAVKLRKKKTAAKRKRTAVKMTSTRPIILEQAAAADF